MGYPHKKNRTRGWAIKEMSIPQNSEISLGRIDRELLDENLILTAIRNGNGRLYEVPADLRTRQVCEEACLYEKGPSASCLNSVPKELMDFEFLMRAHNAHPAWADAVWRYQRKGREDDPLSANDISMLAALAERSPAASEWERFLISYAIRDLTGGCCNV